MKMNTCYCLKFLFAGALTMLVLLSARAQETGQLNKSQEDDTYSIQWVSQYPAVKKKKKENQKGISDILLGEETKQKNSRRNKNWFSNLLFGKKPDNLVKPMSVLAMSPDTLWVADQGTGTFLQVVKGVGEMTHFRNKKIEQLPSIVGSCFLPDNKIVFTDSKLNKIFQFMPGDKDLHILNDSLVLLQPTGIAYSSVNKQIWVVETKAHHISVLDEKGKRIKQIGKRGLEKGEFNFPTHIWIDQLGMVYVVDAMNFRIQVFNKNGEFVSMFGEIGDASGYFSRPKGVATDSFGHIYVADALFHVVQVFDKSGNLLYVFGSQGQEKEQFWMPTGIYIDKDNYIYVADSYNSRVQVFQLSLDRD